MPKLRFEVHPEETKIIIKIGKFTEREPHQVILDALRVYDEVLEAWYNGKQVVILDEETGTHSPLANKNPIKCQHLDLAKEYFESI